MFELYSQRNFIAHVAVRSDRNAWVHASATRLFRRATAGAQWRRFVALCLHRSTALLDLHALQKTLRPRGTCYAGLQTVPLRDIIGSEGRAADFDSSFAPTADHAKSRWLSVAFARYLGLSLPPVALIRIGQAYFVRDGHHRISVARALGEEDIEAEVIVWDVAGPLPWDAPRRRTLEVQTV
jgi:hypothetical protein